MGVKFGNPPLELSLKYHDPPPPPPSCINDLVLAHPRRPRGRQWGREKNLKGRKNMAQRKVKNGEKSPWGQCLTRPVPNGRRRSGF